MNAGARFEHSAHWQFTRAAFLGLWRMPAYSLPTLLFPVGFYVFFGLLMNPAFAQWMLATFATFGVVGTALFAFGVGVAMERSQGWWLLLRAAPTPFSAVLAGKLAAVMGFALMIVLIMAWLAAVFGGVRLESGQWLALVAVLIAGTLPFSLLGLALGLWLSPNAAPAIINVLYLPLALLSGLWIPVSQLPAMVQGLAVWLPPYHLAGLALHVSGTHAGPWLQHLLALAAFTVLSAGLAALAWRRFKGA
ncbi:MAG: ABC transporter permease [Wenzhouxiangella sp.]|nr:MAG: ABC transporter permease [Wenzhouxiangella sp.]